MFNKVGIRIGFASSMIGIFILLLFLATGLEAFVFIGFFYVLIAFLLNTVTLLYLLVDSYINFENLISNLMTGVLLLLNIPLALLCIYIGLKWV